MSFHSTTSALSVYGWTGGPSQQNQWQLVQIITSPTSNDYSYRFGASIGASNDGNYMIVGNPIYTIDGNGTAYIYSYSNSSYSLDQQLIPTTTLTNASFYGTCVQLDGNANIAVIGAPGYDNNKGAVFIFTKSGNIWSQANLIQSNDIANGDFFGNSVSINDAGDYIAVGAPAEDSGATTNNGAVYIFNRSGNVWSQQAKLLSNAIASGAAFGGAVALNQTANRVYIGAYNESNNRGSMYYYTRTGNTWAVTDRAIIGFVNNERACRSIAINNSGTRAYTIGTDVGDFYFYSINGNTLGIFQRIDLNIYASEGGTELAVTCDSTGNIPACVPRVVNSGITFDQPNIAANTLQVSQLLPGSTANGVTPGQIKITNDGNILLLGEIDNQAPPSDGKVYIYRSS